ncbi:hypothetical protein G314FT_04370 [Vagococcus luciliae]|uniref:Uncharacterized protein n=1 Tax=Vagococcus luciliae TaxID=2920380 RepID=A0ABY5NXX9_9ENTE|nr:hypothetical protein G314FT_04370 [Vagococcus luciliae]
MDRHQKIELLQDILKMKTINENEEMVAKYTQNK